MRFRAYGWHTQHVDDANDLDALRAAIAAARAEEREAVADPRALDDRVGRAEQGQHRRRPRRAARRGRGARDEGVLRLGPRQALLRARRRLRALQRGRARRGAAGRVGGALRVLARRRRRSRRRVGPRVGRQAAARPRRRAAGLTAARTSSPRAPPAARRCRRSRRSCRRWSAARPTSTSRSRPASRPTAPTRSEQATRNVYWGIREHAMGAAVNGLALHGGIVRPYGATFLQFADYMRGAIRLSALMRLHVAWVYTHDSVALGEDGPTHQPVEHLAALRAIPDLTVIRPSDATETAEAWRFIVEELDGPGVLVLSRQNLPVLDRSASTGRRAGSTEARTCWPRTRTRSRRSSAPAPRSRSRSRRATCSPARASRCASSRCRAGSCSPRRTRPTARRCCRPASRRSPSRPASRWAGRSCVDASVSIERFGASAPGEIVMRELGMTPEHVADDRALAAVTSCSAQCSVSPRASIATNLSIRLARVSGRFASCTR